MTKKEVVDMVAKLLSFAKEDKPEIKKEEELPVAVEMTKITTKDGIVLETPEKFDVGVPVLIEGQPAPDAVYELEDGSKLEVVEGKVAEIVAIEEAPEEGEMAAVATPKETTVTTIEKHSFSAEDRYKELEEKFNKVLEATVILTEAFNKLPVTDKIVVNASVETEEFGRTSMTKKQRNLKEISSVLAEIQSEQTKKIIK